TQLCFMVRDTGIGIPADKQQVIFNPFVQVDGSLSRKYGGTGLGLAISSRLVEMMGGRLTVESEVGRGSTFHFTVRFELPYDQGERPIPADHLQDACAMPVPDRSGPSHRRRLRILLAEDNLVSQRLAAGILQKQGHVVVAVRNGREALAALENQTFGLVLMDVQMPE